MKLIILPILFSLSTLALDREEENRIKSMTIGDLSFTLDKKILGRHGLVKKKLLIF